MGLFDLFKAPVRHGPAGAAAGAPPPGSGLSGREVMPVREVLPGRNVMPVTVAVDRLLVRRAGLAVFMGGVEVYPDGFDFGVTVLRRHADDVLFDAYRDNPFAAIRGPRPRAGQGRERDAARLLRFAVQYADGRRAEADAASPAEPAEPPGSPGSAGPPEPSGSAGPPRPPVVITPHWTRGGQGLWAQRCWVRPLPERGDVTVVYAWPAEQVPESRVELDGDALREAASRAVVLWPAPPPPVD